MLGRIILGLFITAIGALMTIKSEWLYQNFGTIPSFDKFLGSEGGGRLGYKLIGIFVSFVGLLIMTNLIGVFLQATLGKLFRPLGS